MSTPGPSPNASPSKPGAKSGLPDKLANASLEELQKITMDCLKKLKVLLQAPKCPAQSAVACSTAVTLS